MPIQKHRLNTRVVTEYAWHALFIRHLLRRPGESELLGFVPEFTVVNLPSFRAAPLYHGTRSETVIACNFSRRIVLIGGTELRGRDQEERLLVPELLVAAEGRHAHALLGECRQG